MNIQQFVELHQLGKGKQEVILFAESNGWDITVEDDGALHFRKFFPRKGIRHDLSLSPSGTLLMNVFEGKPIQADLRRGIRSHAEMKECLV